MDSQKKEVLWAWTKHAGKAPAKLWQYAELKLQRKSWYPWNPGNSPFLWLFAQIAQSKRVKASVGTPQKLNETSGRVQVQLAIHRGRIDDRILPGNVQGMSSQKRVVGWNLSNAEFSMKVRSYSAPGSSRTSCPWLRMFQKT